jgi:hypothetical protein
MSAVAVFTNMDVARKIKALSTPFSNLLPLVFPKQLLCASLRSKPLAQQALEYRALL